MSKDPIADMLVALQNAYRVKKERVKIPFSNFKYEILKVMEKKGAIKSVEKKGRKKKFLICELNYDENQNPFFENFKRISKPGQRIYARAKQIKRSKGGYGFFVISTSKGVLSDQEARKLKVGGEVVCEVW